MTFDARPLAADAAEEYQPFPFIGLDGAKHELPHPMSLTTGDAQRFNAAWRGDENQAFDMLRDWAPDAVAAIEAMPVHVTQKLFEQWRELAGEPGKEPSGSSAPNRTARRSKRTSRSGASGSTG